MALITCAIALVLLLIVTRAAWVLLVRVCILVTHLRGGRPGAAGETSEPLDAPAL
jgi:hypothetical protein